MALSACFNLHNLNRELRIGIKQGISVVLRAFGATYIDSDASTPYFTPIDLR